MPFSDIHRWQAGFQLNWGSRILQCEENCGVLWCENSLEWHLWYGQTLVKPPRLNCMKQGGRHNIITMIISILPHPQNATGYYQTFIVLSYCTSLFFLFIRHCFGTTPFYSAVSELCRCNVSACLNKKKKKKKKAWKKCNPNHLIFACWMSESQKKPSRSANNDNWTA